ncbi:MAG: methyltransferase domain-containing protein [Bacillus sp. (in: Bacteria)]|nr:methyltransferase domain-containing protein [Bacillus sp. (in: firmicutes)]
MTEPMNNDSIRRGIQDKYAKVSAGASGFFNYPTGKEGARLLGYEPAILSDMEETVLESFCGVGNPFSVGPIHEGETVLDIGCGAGFDLITASKYTGKTGHIYGIDLTPAMIEKAKRNIHKGEYTNISVEEGTAESLPFADSSFHVIISNGAINLSTNKEKTFKEIFRVLRPGGRLQLADIVLKEELPKETLDSVDAWSN